MATTESARDAPEQEPELQLDDDDLEDFDPRWNLQQRHAAIMRSLALLGIDVTGQNRFGVVSSYRFAAGPDGWPLVRAVDLEKSQEEGVYERWEVAVISVIRDTRDETDGRETEEALLFDVGSNPSAAVSFALKRHKRELYHLGAVKEGVSDEGRQGGGGRARGPSRRELEGKPCPLCRHVGALGWSQNKGLYFCAQGKGGCGEEFASLEAPEERQELAEDRAEEFARLLALGSYVGVVNGTRKQGAPMWPAARLRPRIKHFADTRATFEGMSDPDWRKGVDKVQAEIEAEHRKWCGAKCEHLVS